MNPKYSNPDASESSHRISLTIYLLLAAFVLFLSGCRAAGCGCPMY